MNAPVTRRALLGATAAVGAMSLPALAEAGIPVSHPDAELLRLLDAWDSARASAEVAGARADALWDAFNEQEPARPDALRWSGNDGLNCGFEVEDRPDGRRVVFYGLAQIGRLMSSPLPTRSEWRGKPAPWNPDEQVGQWVPVPDERGIARRAEVVDAHHVWTAECGAVRERLGIPAADEAEEDASRALREVEDAILAAAPLTMAGLAAKARWTSQCRLGATFAAEGHRRIVEDVLALAERGEALS